MLPSDRLYRGLDHLLVHLTDSEIGIVMRAAQPLAPKDRDAFLKDIAERLGGLPHLGDGLVFQICREVQHRHFDPPAGDLDAYRRPPRKYGTLC
jgi:hypothetical protein